MLPAVLLALLVWIGSEALFVGGDSTSGADSDTGEMPPDTVSDLDRSHRDTDSPSEDAALADHLSGQLYAMRSALAAGRLGEAWRAITKAGDLGDLPPALRSKREAGEAELSKATAGQVDVLREKIASGRILEASEIVTAMRETTHAKVEEALASVIPELAVDAEPPADEDLAPDRRVRSKAEGFSSKARVVRTRGSEVTLKVWTEKGVIYPVVTRLSVEPVAASIDEALRQIGLAMSADDGLLACLWLAYCEAGGAAEDPRVRRLRLR